MNFRISLPVFLTAAPLLCAGAELSFNRDIRPILSENCFYCHGQDGNKREADLRLDDREVAVKAGAIVPGDAAASELVKRLLTTDPEDQMPPPKSNRHVSPEQREKLQRWIAEGAKYETHWTFTAPVRPAAPPVADAAWSRNEIDRFVLAKLEAAGLTPSPEAERVTLMRRLYLDLTGLPPEPADVDAFLADAAPDAWERLVERTLASPHFGERLALPWLDAARYADSNGFQQEGDTHQYVWRDWVVRALNADMPFDQFSIEQLAGDLLPDPTEDQLVATAFNRNHMLNGEGGAIAEEQRNVILFDRVDTTATTWLGLTMACAQCHDHKYDPMTQRDYYSMMALFNNVPETGTPPGGGQYRIADPWLAVGTPEEKVRMGELEALAAAARQAEGKAAALPETKGAYEKMERELAADAEVIWSVPKPAALSATDGVMLSVLDEDGSIYAEGPLPDKANYTVTLPVFASGVTGFRLETIPDRRLPNKGAGRSDSGNAVLTKLRLSVNGVEIPFSAATADYTQGGFSPEGVIDDDPATAWAFYPATNKPYALVVQCAEPLELPVGTLVEMTLEFQSRHAQHQLGRFRISMTAAAQPASRKAIPDEISGVLRKPERSKEEAKKLRDYLVKSTPPPAVAKARAEKEAAEKAFKDFQGTMARVMVMSDAKPRATHIYDRGTYTSPLGEVTSDTPAFLPPLPPDAPRNRLGFARWIFSEGNPLTARVQVNRMWQYFFGTGLVKTSEDLGVQSEVPVHGPLLDWLAVEFREGGWSQKHMIRLIVTSSTYRQSSRSPAELLATDPENRLMSRAARIRQPSLILRDIALSASGLLNPLAGGKPVYPYQPGDVWENLDITKERDFTYPASHGQDLYRRSLYTFWRRTIGPVNFFDTSARQACKVRQAITSTPLHALTTLNDVTWTESARVLAGKALHISPDRDAQLTWAFRRVLVRAPQPTDLQILNRAYYKQFTHYSADLPAAAAFLATGESVRDTSLDPVEHAAMTAVCLALFNLDEALTRE